MHKGHTLPLVHTTVFFNGNVQHLVEKSIKQVAAMEREVLLDFLPLHS